MAGKKIKEFKQATTVNDTDVMLLESATETQHVKVSALIARILSGNASSATKLAAARTIGVSGLTGAAQPFNGESNITIPITNVPMSLLTGAPTVATVDWNNYIQGGFYRGEALLHSPPAINGSDVWWYVIAVRHNDTNGLQIATDFYGKATYRRVLKSGVWEDWVLIPDANNAKTALGIDAINSEITGLNTSKVDKKICINETVQTGGVKTIAFADNTMGLMFAHLSGSNFEILQTYSTHVRNSDVAAFTLLSSTSFNPNSLPAPAFTRSGKNMVITNPTGIQLTFKVNFVSAF